MGIRSLTPFLEDAYGHIEIIGKGESRYSAMPCYGLPDFVAVSSRGNKPILVEVKNTQKRSTADIFQAKFYNTLESTVGVVVVAEHVEGSESVMKPKVISSQDAETLIIYPRLKDYTKVSDVLEMDDDLLKETWKAKQLGFQGKWPLTHCGPKCPHIRFGIDLVEDDLEVLKPIPLVLAKGLDEMGVDLDLTFWRSYLRKRVPIVTFLSPKYRKRIVETLINKFELTREEARKITERRGERFKTSDIAKLMVNEVEDWHKILESDFSIEHALGISTRIYPLPERSSSNVKASWHKWE